jgi:hypothetical protein
MRWKFSRSHIEDWFESRFEGFIVQEVGLHRWKFEHCKQIVLYGDVNMDEYEVFLVDFPVSLYQWLQQLEETLEHTYGERKIVEWNVHNLVVLQQVDCQITHMIDFLVKTLVEGFIVDAYRSFSKAEK